MCGDGKEAVRLVRPARSEKELREAGKALEVERARKFGQPFLSEGDQP